ncbi:hypothetical protein WJX79_008430 [Trebouxia sp. C0005]
MACENTEVTSARMTAAKALELSIDPSRARCVELECLLQAKTAHISHLELLEQQLVSLSHMLREKEQQIDALQETVQQQCDERTLMHIKYMQLQSAHQMESLSTASGNSPVQSIVEGSHIAQTASASEGSMSHSTLLSSQTSAGKHMPEKAEAPAQIKGKLNRLASASEQQHGKSGLLGRLMATSSKTGKTV